RRKRSPSVCILRDCRWVYAAGTRQARPAAALCFAPKSYARTSTIMDMSTTKVYSITMPPDLARQAEALAKKENRTMSELMREALRRYQQPKFIFDAREFVRQIAPTPASMRAIQQDAKRKGTDKLTMAQIQREVRAVRRQEAKKKTNRRSK